MFPLTVDPVARDHEQDRDKATPPGPPTRRHGEGDASEGWRGGEGEAPEVTNSGDHVAETGLTRSASHPPSRDWGERSSLIFQTTLNQFLIPAKPVSICHFLESSVQQTGRGSRFLGGGGGVACNRRGFLIFNPFPTILKQ